MRRGNNMRARACARKRERPTNIEDYLRATRLSTLINGLGGGRVYFSSPLFIIYYLFLLLIFNFFFLSFFFSLYISRPVTRCAQLVRYYGDSPRTGNSPLQSANQKRIASALKIAPPPQGAKQQRSNVTRTNGIYDLTDDKSQWVVAIFKFRCPFYIYI